MRQFFLLGILSIMACTQDRAAIESVQADAAATHLSAAQWRIRLFIEDGEDYSRHFENYRLEFSADGKLSLLNASAERVREGRWRFFEDDEKTEFEISLLTGNKYEELNDDWYVITVSANEMRFEDNTGSHPERLILERML